MANEKVVDEKSTNKEATKKSEPNPGTSAKVRRKIPGGLPYTSSPGVLRRVLERIPVCEKPGVFSPDFLSTVIGATGGASRPIIPILKSAGLLNQTGTPTDIYAQFQTDSGRPQAALAALRTGWGEIFKRNQFAHRAEEKAIIDVITAVTGLPKTDTVARYMLSTFQAFQEYAKRSRDDDFEKHILLDEEPISNPVDDRRISSGHTNTNRLGLAYHIHIILPETTNVEVYNAIFKSIKGNLL